MASYWTEGEPHDCCMTVEREEKIRPDLLTLQRELWCFQVDAVSEIRVEH